MLMSCRLYKLIILDLCIVGLAVLHNLTALLFTVQLGASEIIYNINK